MIMCKNKCEPYRAKRQKMGRYNRGQKRCSRCDIFIEWDGVRCPCCNGVLRVSPTGMTKYRARYHDQSGVKRY